MTTTILDTPPKYCIFAEMAGAKRTLKLDLGAIERWEDMHPEGIYKMYQRSTDFDNPPSYKLVRDLLIVGLMSGGSDEETVKGIFDIEGPENILKHRVIAVLLLQAALESDKPNAGEGDDDSGKKPPTEKKQGN